jgi:DNA polymerase
MGDKKFVHAAKTFGVTVTPQQAAIAVNRYRNKFPLVQQSWYKLTNAARMAIQNPGTEVPCFKVKFLFDGSTLWTILPSGRKLCYPEACIKDGDIQYMSTNAKTTQWCTHRLTPSQNIENIIQAMAADILEYGLINVDEMLPDHETIGHVHDEILTLVPEDYPQALGYLVDVMCLIPSWAKGLPLFAEGYIQRRFKK